MKASSLLMIAAMTAAPLLGSDLQQVADSLTLPELRPGATRLTIPKIPGAKVEILGADYEQLIDTKGNIKQVVENTPVLLSFKVSKGEEQVISKDYELMLKPGNQPTGANPKPTVIPEILQWAGSTGEFKLGETVSLYCKNASLAAIITADLHEVTGKNVKLVDNQDEADIVLRTVAKQDSHDADKEGYRMQVGEKKLQITADCWKGAYWGTRTLLQILRQTGGSVPCGKAVDFPRYELRGFMLDIARTPVPLSYLKDVIRAMSWFKMNDLHLVINNNYIFHENYVDAGRDPFKESYSAFRLESKVKGADGTPLTAQDLFYTKKEFMELVKFAKERNVNIIPEFDTPGHALSFTRVRPDLIYKGPMKHAKRRCEMLDAANPETVSFVGGVFDEYLQKDENLGAAVFENCPVVHVGADEFFGEKEDYRKFADGLLRHVLNRGYTPRIWGSLSSKPGKTPVVAEGVQMNLWSSDWMKAWEAINLGYDVINTNDGALYIVPFANYYRMDKCHKWLYANWKPNVVGKEMLPAGHPQLLGATFAVWNDMTDAKHSGYAPYDVWPAITESIEILSQKMWGKEAMPLEFDAHKKLVSRIGAAPFCNPLYKWQSKEPVNITPSLLPQKLALPALGPDYHLTMELELASAPEGQEQVLLSSPEGKLIAVMKDGTIGFRRDDTLEFSFGAKLPVGKKIKVELIGRPEKTQLLIDGKPAGEMVLNTYLDSENGFSKKTKGVRSTFVLPLEVLGESLLGKVYSFNLTPSAPEQK